MSRRFKCACTLFAHDSKTGLHQRIDKGTIWELVSVENDTVTLKNVAEEGFELYLSSKAFATHFEVI